MRLGDVSLIAQIQALKDIRDEVGLGRYSYLSREYDDHPDGERLSAGLREAIVTLERLQERGEL